MAAAVAKHDSEPKTTCYILCEYSLVSGNLTAAHTRLRLDYCIYFIFTRVITYVEN